MWKKARQKFGWTQRAVAERTGYSESGVCAFEKGHFRSMALALFYVSNFAITSGELLEYMRQEGKQVGN